MDTQMILLGVGGIFVALILLKFIIKLPLLLIKYGIMALIVYVIYMVATGRIQF